MGNQLTATTITGGYILMEPGRAARRHTGLDASEAMNVHKAWLSQSCGQGCATMKTNPAPTPLEKEVQRLHERGKTPDLIAIRLGMKISKVLLVLAMFPKP